MSREHFSLLIGLILAALSALGYGLLAGKVLKLPGNLAGYGVIGMAVLAALSTTEHFVVPLRESVNLFSILPGIVAFVALYRRNLWSQLLVIMLMLGWACRISMTGRLPYDTGLYHLQSMIWNNIDSAIPGIANIHTRLGFDSALFILGAGLNMPHLGGWSLSFLSAAILGGMIAADLLLSIRSSSERVAAIYSLVAVICLLFRPRWLLEPGYLSPDPVIAMGVIYATLLFLDKRIQALLLCAPFLSTVKLSATPLLFLINWNQSVRRYRPVAVVGMSVLCLWLARNVVLSGYVVFPVAATQMPVSWAVPKPETSRTAEWITSWARERGRTPEETRGLHWIRPWLGRTVLDRRLWFVALIVVASVLLLLWKRAFSRVDLRPLVVIGVALTYWLVAAPDVRFGIGFMFALAFLLFAVAVNEIQRPRFAWNSKAAIVGILAVGYAVSAISQVGPEWPALEQPKVRMASTATGNLVWTPVEGDQCWSVIPCSPEPQRITYFPARVVEIGR